MPCIGGVKFVVMPKKILPSFVSNSLDTLAVRLLARLPARVGRRFLSLLHRNPHLGDKWGHFVREIHFYEPLPDFSRITRERVVRRRESPAIDWNVAAQTSLWRELAAYQPEVAALVSSGSYSFHNESFRDLDAATYYALVRHLKPANILEIGSGYSSQIAQLALDKNRVEGRAGAQICIEPYPLPRLTDKKLPIELVQEKIQDVPLDRFRQLQAGDILFIDSTHTVKFDGDVCREVLEILPVLASGVWVHIHDIFFPYDYPPEWIIDNRTAWNEQYLIEAFLEYNTAFEVRLALHWLTVDHPGEIAWLWPEAAQWPVPSYNGSSFWLRKR